MNRTTYRLASNTTFSCDILIIGSGAGGSCVAKTLTENGYDVLMVEEGPYVPASEKPSSLPHAFYQLWRHAGITAALGRSPIAYAEGCCVGGSTEINSAIFQQTPDALLDQWAEQYRIADFGPDALAPFFNEARAIVNVCPTKPPLGRASDLLREAAEKMGWKVAENERGQRGCVGTNMCAHGCPTDGRQSMLNTLIPKALERGMRLVSDCKVERLVMKNQRVFKAVGTALGPDGRPYRVTIKPKHVFMCAGAIQTPFLLRRSGITYHIGNTMRFHPTIKVTAVFPERVDAHLTRFPLYAVTEFMPDMRMGGSLINLPLAGIYAVEDWPRRGKTIEQLDCLASYYAMVRSDGAGKIRAVPGFGAPLVTYKMTPRDWQWLSKGVSGLAEALFAAGATAVYPSLQNHPGWHAREACREFLNKPLPRGRTRLMSVHIFSSCPLGEDENLCATDSFGNVRGIDNLIIADASQIPEAPGTNPQGTIMAIALRNAAHFCHERSS